LATLESLGNLKNFVEDFATFSGLHSNADKTTLLQIGNVAPLQNGIRNLGFNIVESVTLLGLNIDNELSFISNYFEGVITKIQNIIEYWDRFYLSLAGRISVCKTFMLSQIGYIGSILSPTNNQLKRLQDLMDKFCLGSMRVAKKKLYLPPSLGGLGLIKISSYTTALQCAWVKRTVEHWCDNWRFDIKKACYGNPLIANEGTFSRVSNPILHNLCSSFGKFTLEFYKKERNYKKALIFKNRMFKRGRNDDGILDENFFGFNRSFAEFMRIAKMKFDDFFVRGRPKSLNQLNLDSGIDFDLNCYMRIHEALQFYITTRRNDEPLPEQSVGFFLKTFTRGSRPYRRTMEFYLNSREKITENNTVITFFRLINSEIFDEATLKKCWGMWNNSFFFNPQREFLFKYFNNILGLNARVTKFVAGHPAECTFCVASNEPLPINAEGFVHIFFECQYSENYRRMAEAEFFPEIAGETIVNRKLFWMLGVVPDGLGYKINLFMQSAVLSFNFLLWKMKLGKIMLPTSIIKSDFIYSCKRLLLKSVKLREARTNDHFFLCRNIL
jgi:hypothetical protein